MPTIVCNGKRTKEVRIDRTFFQAKMAVENVATNEWGEPQYTLQEFAPGFFIVTEHGQTRGKGVTYETAIADFESNVNPRWMI